jgi:riboflavin synthase
MFTGIVETTAPVLERSDSRLTLARPASFDDGSAGSPQAPKIGNSIAVNGTCLTIVEIDKDTMSFDVVGETWRRTNLGDLLVGNTVNLERAMPANGRFEGHVVQGHVEGIAIVKEWKADGQWKMLELEVPQELLPYITEKGSIALDGVSLTVAGLQGNIVTIALIPHTLEVTTLGLRQEGDRINVETDILAHYSSKKN